MECKWGDDKMYIKEELKLLNVMNNKDWLQKFGGLHTPFTHITKILRISSSGTWRRVDIVRNDDVSKEHVSIFRIEKMRVREKL
jgi:hypothetical protein